MEFHVIGLNSDNQQVRNITLFFVKLYYNSQFDIKPIKLLNKYLIGIEKLFQKTHSVKSTFWNFISLEF